MPANSSSHSDEFISFPSRTKRQRQREYIRLADIRHFLTPLAASDRVLDGRHTLNRVVVAKLPRRKDANATLPSVKKSRYFFDANKNLLIFPEAVRGKLSLNSMCFGIL